MAAIPNLLADHFAAHHGVASIETMTLHGLTLREIQELSAAGRLVRVHRTVYRLLSAPDTLEARCVAATAAHPRLTVTGPTAGRLWGLRRVPRTELVVAIAPIGDAPSLHGVVVRRTSSLPENDVVDRPDGIRVASPVRALFDLAPRVTDEAFESIVEQVLDRFCSISTVLNVQQRLAHRGRGGAARANRVLGSRPAWRQPADSDLELRVVRGLARRGLELVTQHRLQLAPGRAIHLDAADPAIRWGLEIDHVTWHGGRIDAQRDKGRDRMARLVGWQIERVSDVEFAEAPNAVLDQLVALHAERSRQLRDLFASQT